MPRTWAVFLLLLVTGVWGATFPVVKGALASASFAVFLSLRFALACLVAVLSTFGRGRPRWEPAALLAGLLLFAGYAFQTAGLVGTLPSRSAFITSLSVIMVPVLQWAVQGKSPPGRVWFAALLAVVGLGVLLRPEVEPPNWGDALTFCCAVAFAGHVLALENAVKRQHPALVNLVQISVVAACSPLLALASEARLQWTWKLGVALVITGVVASAFAFAAMAKVLRVLQAGEAGVILAFEPVAAAVVAMLLGYEEGSLSMLVGGSLVVTGVAWVAAAER